MSSNPKNKSNSKKKSNHKPKPDTSRPPPRECTEEEYKEFLAQASSLTFDEAKFELLDCARYGELDAVRALLQIWSSKPNNDDHDDDGKNTDSKYINTTDDSGSTALHKSSANGHISTTHLLLSSGSAFTKNTSGGNTPLHWAASSGHASVVELLLYHDDFKNDLDVLEKNEFGRSALTEGFASGDTDVVRLLLEHESADEERLLGGGKEVDDDENIADGGGSDRGKATLDGTDKKVVEGVGIKKDDISAGDMADGESSCNTSSSTKSIGVTHEFDFLRDGNEDVAETNASSSNNIEGSLMANDDDANPPTTLLIRELPIKNADNPFGDVAEDDTTGLAIWCASLVMARWMAAKSILGRFDGKTILELGAGCGVPGLTVALYSSATRVYVTDLNPSTVKNLQYNVDLNGNSDHLCTKSREEWVERVTASAIDWGKESTWPEEKVDYVIGSDLIYQKSIVPLLKKVVGGLLKDDGSFLYVCPSDGRDGLKEFISVMKKDGFKCVSEETAPDMYRSNPLSNGDAEDALLHFYELPITEYRLYEFRRC